MTHVLAVGSVALDTVETPAGKRNDLLGGSATHFALSARHFAGVQLVGVVGKDFPKEHLALLKELKIDTKGIVQKADGLTFRWHGRYDQRLMSRETVSVALNVLGTFQPEIPASYRKTPYVLLGNASPHTQRKVLEQLEKPKFVLLDTMDLWIETEREALRELLPRINAICINHEEAMQLAEQQSLARAIPQLLDWGVPTVIIKKAEHGASMATRDFIFAAPSFPTQTVVDPTGAGDSFAGGFLGYLAKAGTADGNLKRALLYGTVMGSLCVEEFGIERLRRAKPAEIEKRYKALLEMITL